MPSAFPLSSAAILSALDLGGVPSLFGSIIDAENGGDALKGKFRKRGADLAVLRRSFFAEAEHAADNRRPIKTHTRLGQIDGTRVDVRGVAENNATLVGADDNRRFLVVNDLRLRRFIREHRSDPLEIAIGHII